MKNIKLLISIILLGLIGCKDNGTTPIEVPVSYQEDIPWPSLADSPWPMNHHDPQSSGRSRYIGPQIGILAGKIPCDAMQGGIALGSKSDLYFVSRNEIFSSSYDGNIMWQDSIGYELYNVPLVLSDRTIITADAQKYLIAYYPDGSIKWKYSIPNGIQMLSVNVDKAGNIYCLENSLPSTLYVIDQNGNLNWKLTDERFLMNSHSAPVFSPDGNILYIQGFTVLVLAVNISTRKIEWTFGNGRLENSPIVDSEGNIYIYPNSKQNGKNSFYSLKPDGSIRWEFVYNGRESIMPNSEPTIDKNGNIYFGLDTLYSLTYEGVIRWKKGFEYGWNLSPIVCDAANNIYVGLGGDLGHSVIKCLTDKGEEKYSIDVLNERQLSISPAITENGILFYPTFRSKNILIIK